MTFYKTFLSLCKAKNVRPSRAAEDCGINRSNVSNWKSNGYTPRGDALQRLADYFEVSVDYLLGNTKEKITEKPTPENGDEPDPLTVRLNELLDQMTDETKLAMIALLEQFLKRPETQVSLRR